MPIPTATVTAHVSLASVTARPAGRASGAIRWTSRCTSACRAAPITGHTTSNLRPAFARSTGPGSIARSRVAAWTADLTDPASRAVASQYIHINSHTHMSSFRYISRRPLWVLCERCDRDSGIGLAVCAEPTARCSPGLNEESDACLNVPVVFLGLKEFHATSIRSLSVVRCRHLARDHCLMPGDLRNCANVATIYVCGLRLLYGAKERQSFATFTTGIYGVNRLISRSKTEMSFQ